MTSAHRRIHHHRLAHREQTIMLLLLSLLLASCAHTPREARSPSEVTLDPLSLRIPFGIDLLEEGIDPRWDDLHDMESRHSEAFGLDREYDPSWIVAACRSSLLEDLPYERCVRFAANAAADDYPLDAGAMFILVARPRVKGSRSSV